MFAPTSWKWSIISPSIHQCRGGLRPLVFCRSLFNHPPPAGCRAQHQAAPPVVMLITRGVLPPTSPCHRVDADKWLGHVRNGVMCYKLKLAVWWVDILSTIRWLENCRADDVTGLWDRQKPFDIWLKEQMVFIGKPLLVQSESIWSIAVCLETHSRLGRLYIIFLFFFSFWLFTRPASRHWRDRALVSHSKKYLFPSHFPKSAYRKCLICTKSSTWKPPDFSTESQTILVITQWQQIGQWRQFQIRIGSSEPTDRWLWHATVSSEQRCTFFFCSPTYS